MDEGCEVLRGRIEFQIWRCLPRSWPALDGLPQRAQIPDDDLPDRLAVHIPIAVYQAIPHPCDRAPGDLRPPTAKAHGPPRGSMKIGVGVGRAGKPRFSEIRPDLINRCV